MGREDFPVYKAGRELCPAAHFPGAKYREHCPPADSAAGFLLCPPPLLSGVMEVAIEKLKGPGAWHVWRLSPADPEQLPLLEVQTRGVQSEGQRERSGRAPTTGQCLPPATELTGRMVGILLGL